MLIKIPAVAKVKSLSWKCRPIYFLTREITPDPYYIDYKDVHEYLNRVVQFNISRQRSDAPE